VILTLVLSTGNDLGSGLAKLVDGVAMEPADPSAVNSLRLEIPFFSYLFMLIGPLVL